MTIKEHVGKALETLNEAELAKVAEYVSFIKFHSRTRAISSIDANQLASLYAESASEDRCLAEEGMEDFSRGLVAEDSL